jgi:hypothetical protein
VLFDSGDTDFSLSMSMSMGNYYQSTTSTDSASSSDSGVGSAYNSDSGSGSNVGNSFDSFSPSEFPSFTPAFSPVILDDALNLEPTVETAGPTNITGAVELPEPDSDGNLIVNGSVSEKGIGAKPKATLVAVFLAAVAVAGVAIGARKFSKRANAAKKDKAEQPHKIHSEVSTIEPPGAFVSAVDSSNVSEENRAEI